MKIKLNKNLWDALLFTLVSTYSITISANEIIDDSYIDDYTFHFAESSIDKNNAKFTDFQRFNTTTIQFENEMYLASLSTTDTLDAEPFLSTVSSSSLSDNNDNLPVISPELIEKDWWGAVTEISVLLVIGEVLYVTSEESMEGDFDYEIDGNAGEYFVDRIVTTDSWKLDDNKVGMNWGHSYAGALYYQAFRNYNFNFYESMAGDFIASGIWEVFAEYKEAVSVNDQIVTTFGGAVLGESLFQLSEMLDSKEGWVPVAFSSVFNPAKTIKGWFGYDNPQRFNRDFAEDKFAIYTGGMYSTKSQADTNTTTLLLGLEARVDSEQGQYDGLSATPNQVSLDMELGVSEEGIEDWQMASSIYLGGFSGEAYTPNNSKKPEQKWFIGPSMGLEYSSLGQDDEEDFYAAINVIGLSAGIDWFFSDVSFGIRGDIFSDFSMVKPFATKDYRQNGGHFWGTKSVLWEGEYAYALGHTAKMNIEANYKDLILGFKFQSQRWDSIDDNEFNRSSDWNPNKSDLDFKDARDRYEVYLVVPLTDTMGISVHHERIDRSGTITGIENLAIANRNDDTESRSSVRFVYQY